MDEQAPISMTSEETEPPRIKVFSRSGELDGELQYHRFVPPSPFHRFRAMPSGRLYEQELKFVRWDEDVLGRFARYRVAKTVKRK